MDSLTPMPPTSLEPTLLAAVFKAYDIRGVVPDQIDEGLARAVGNAFVAVTGASAIVVGLDMRPSSPALAAAFADGATLAGADVTLIGLVEYAVEDAPQIPDDWNLTTVPLSSLVRGSGASPTRLVVFRRPIEHRAESRADLEALVRTVVVEQVAELLGITPEQVDPHYETD